MTNTRLSPGLALRSPGIQEKKRPEGFLSWKHFLGILCVSARGSSLFSRPFATLTQAAKVSHPRSLRDALGSSSFPYVTLSFAFSASLRENAFVLSHHSSLLPDFGPWTSDAGIPPTIHHLRLTIFRPSRITISRLCERHKLFLATSTQP